MDRTSEFKVRLCEGAVPSLFLGYPARHQPSVNKRRKSPVRRDPTDSNSQADTHPCSCQEQMEIAEHVITEACF